MTQLKVKETQILFSSDSQSIPSSNDLFFFTTNETFAFFFCSYISQTWTFPSCLKLFSFVLLEKLEKPFDYHVNTSTIFENPLNCLEFYHQFWQVHQQLIHKIVELKLLEGIWQSLWNHINLDFIVDFTPRIFISLKSVIKWII